MVRPDVAGINVKADANAPLAVNTAAAAGLHQGKGVALMAVGGAGLVAGLLIGDSAGTAIAIGGLAVGLVTVRVRTVACICDTSFPRKRESMLSIFSVALAPSGSATDGFPLSRE